jgi:hypothetical protein
MFASSSFLPTPEFRSNCAAIQDCNSNAAEHEKPMVALYTALNAIKRRFGSASHKNRPYPVERAQHLMPGRAHVNTDIVTRAMSPITLVLVGSCNSPLRRILLASSCSGFVCLRKETSTMYVR